MLRVRGVGAAATRPEGPRPEGRDRLPPRNRRVPRPTRLALAQASHQLRAGRPGAPGGRALEAVEKVVLSMGAGSCRISHARSPGQRKAAPFGKQWEAEVNTFPETGRPAPGAVSWCDGGIRGPESKAETQYQRSRSFSTALCRSWHWRAGDTLVAAATRKSSDTTQQLR